MHNYLLECEEIAPEDKVIFSQIKSGQADSVQISRALVTLMKMMYIYYHKTVILLLDGEGRSDVVVIDFYGGRVAVFDAKYFKSLERLEDERNKALKQMDEKMYAKDLKDDYDEILCYGITFFKKRCLVKKQDVRCNY